MSFNYDVRLAFDTSFTGKDLLRTTLRSGNAAASAFGFANGVTTGTAMEAFFQDPTIAGTAVNNVVGINRLFYQFPIGSNFTATFGARVRQDDMLAVWPSAYPADTILDFFTYAGAPGTYTLNLGAGAGLWWKAGGFSLSASYVSANGDSGNSNPYAGVNASGAPIYGGIATAASQQTSTVQLAYSGANYGLAAAYANNAHGGTAGLYGGNGTPLAAGGYATVNSVVNSFGLSAYWSPLSASWFPSLSTGWGINNYTSNNSGSFAALNYAGTKSQSWYLGMQWGDVLLKGNTFGMAFGQPTFVTSNSNGTSGANDGNYAWEWWYKMQVTDNISVTPALYYLSAPLGELQKVNGQSFNNFGGLVKTTFRF